METEVTGPPTIVDHYLRVRRALEAIEAAHTRFREGRIAFPYTLDAMVRRELDASRESAQALGRLTLGELQHFVPPSAQNLVDTFAAWQRAFRDAL